MFAGHLLDCVSDLCGFLMTVFFTCMQVNNIEDKKNNINMLAKLIQLNMLVETAFDIPDLKFYMNLCCIIKGLYFFSGNYNKKYILK